MPNSHGKSIDTSFLSLNRVPKYMNIHRDYIAHVLRWSYVLKYLRANKLHKTAHVLDVGCGREAPLARTLFSNMMTHTTGSYTGVDYGQTGRPESMPEDQKKFKTFFHPNTDFVHAKLGREQYDVVTCFEMLEHVEPLHGFATLRRIRSHLGETSRAFISTPCYSPKVGAAKSHVNEMSFAAFRAVLLLLGFKIENVFGTFASQTDYKNHLSHDHERIFKQLSEYYLPEMLSCIFAPLYPAQSRNCLWEVTAGPFVLTADATLYEPKQSSSASWAEDWEKMNVQTMSFLRKRRP